MGEWGRNVSDWIVGDAQTKTQAEDENEDEREHEHERRDKKEGWVEVWVEGRKEWGGMTIIVY